MAKSTCPSLTIGVHYSVNLSVCVCMYVFVANCFHKCLIYKSDVSYHRILYLSVGEGTFGLVRQARAEGIVESTPERNIVAVKTTRGKMI